MRKRLSILAVLATTLAVFAGFTTGTANAASAATQGQSAVSTVDLNNLVCNVPDRTGRIGVYNKAKLLYYARGGKDPCGRTVNKIWAAMGITSQVAKKMNLGTICASDGWISSGRRHSPRPSLDKPHHTGGQRWYSRPLWVWGDTCYRAWKGWTEDGHQVAVLESCGNGEFKKLPPKRHKHHQPTPSYSCTNLSLSSSSLQTGEAVTATVTYRSKRATFQSVDYSWGDNSPMTNGGTSMAHTYNTAGQYTVRATVNFTLQTGKRKSATSAACSKPLTVTPPPCTSSLVSTTTLNDLDAGGSSPNFKVTVATCAGESDTLVLTSRFGSFSPNMFSTTGLNTYTSTYTAPGEVPQGDPTYNIPPGYDRVWAKLYNPSGELVDSSSQLVLINPPPLSN